MTYDNSTGYHGNSCEDCSVGYFRERMGPLGPICVPCDCHGHADTCHPLTGECVTLRPADPEDVPGGDPGDDGPRGPGGDDPDSDELAKDPDAIIEFCHFRPDLCEVVTDEEHCNHNTTGAQGDNSIDILSFWGIFVETNLRLHYFLAN